MQDPKQIESSIQEIRDLIAEYPKLAIPIGAVVSLLFLATTIKTLMDGFSWSYLKWGLPGVFWVIAIIVISSTLLIFAIKHLLRPRPVITPLATPLLSRCPTLRWSYNAAHANEVEYQVQISPDNDGLTTVLKVPRRMTFKELSGNHGRLMIRVNAVLNDEVIRASALSMVEIYQDSIQRIAQDKVIRVAVHADPGEDIFCFHDGNDWGGFDIHLCKLIAAHLQTQTDIVPVGTEIEVEPVFYSWPEIISAANDFEVDFAIASISISPERSKESSILFSDTYAQSGLGVVFYAAGAGITADDEIALDQLMDKKIAVHFDTTASRLFDKASVDAKYKEKFHVVVAHTNAEIMGLLANGVVDVVVYDYLRSFSFLGKGVVAGKLRHDIDIPIDDYGIVFAPINAPLCELVNAFIKAHAQEIHDDLDKRIQNKKESIV